MLTVVLYNAQMCRQQDIITHNYPVLEKTMQNSLFWTVVQTWHCFGYPLYPLPKAAVSHVQCILGLFLSLCELHNQILNQNIPQSRLKTDC